MNDELVKLVASNIDKWCEELLKKSSSRGQLQLQFKLSDRRSHIAIDFDKSNGFDALFSGEQVRILTEDEVEIAVKADSNLKFLIATSNKYAVSASRLMRFDKETKLDSGLETLFLTLGILKWVRPDETEMFSPLAVLPVNIIGDRQGRIYFQSRDNGQVANNLALTLNLENYFDLQLPDASSVTSSKLLIKWHKNVRESVKSLKWPVIDSLEFAPTSPAFALSTMTFQNESIYQDIRQNAENLSQSELVQSLVAKFGNAPDLNNGEKFVEKNLVDQVLPTEEALDIFEADSSQRVCIDAARRGLSFVMDGPPGTGKTQTITNILSNLLAEDKSVLFVAEKSTALDAVYDNLAKRNLAQHVLRLQDGKNTRKSFASQLNQVLEFAEKQKNVKSQVSNKTISEFRNLRKDLATNSEVLSKVHPGFQTTYSNLIGMVTKSSVSPIPKLESAPKLLPVLNSHDELVKKINYVEALAKSWEPVEFPNKSNWYLVDHNLTMQEVELIKRNSAIILGYLKAIGFDPSFNSVEQVSSLSKLASAVNSKTFPSIRNGNTFGQLIDDQELLNELYWCRSEVESFIKKYKLTSEKLDLLKNFVATSEFEILSDAMNKISPELRSGLSINRRLDEVQQQESRLRDVISTAAKAANQANLTNYATWADISTIKDYLSNSAASLRPSSKWFHPVRISVGKLQSGLEKLLEQIEIIDSAENLLIDLYGSMDKTPKLEDFAEVVEKNSWYRRLSREYREALEKLNKNAISKINLDQALAIHQALQNARVADARIQSILRTEPYFSSYKISNLTQYKELSDAIKLAITHLVDSANPYSPYLTALSNSSLFQENEQLNSDPDITKFIDAATVIFEIQNRAGEINLKYLLGNRTVESSLVAISDFTAALTLYRDNQAKIAEFISSDDLEMVSTFITDCKTFNGNLQLIKIKTAKLKCKDFSTFDFHTLSALNNFIAPVLNSLSPLADYDLETISFTANLDEDKLQGLIKLDNDISRYLIASNLLQSQNNFNDVISLLENLISDKKSYDLRTDYQLLFQRSIEFDLEDIMKLAKITKVKAINLRDFVEGVLAKIVVDEIFDQEQILSIENTRTIDDKIEKFKILDTELLSNSAKLVSRKLADRTSLATSASRSMVTANAKLTRNVPSIESQISSLGKDVLNIAPVVMASPLNVSRYLPAEIQFDYVIFDEASQMYPAYALTSLYRAKSAIISGDEKQMPPSKLIGAISFEDDEDFEENEISEAPSGKKTQDFESLLDLAIISPSFLRSMLQWHYRSKKEGLIAFSNKEFYENKLITFPSASEADAQKAVDFIYVSEGVWIPGSKSPNGKSIGGTGGTNQVEAQHVARAVQTHAHGFTDSNADSFEKSLMVIAMGKSQQEAIDGQLQKLRELDKVLDEFLSNDDPKQSFLLKNLENAQGDERDFVFLSFGYNRRATSDKSLVVTQFGPLSDEKGWRRLNVAITRARYHVKVFASFRASNLPDQAKKSVRHIKNYLDYAERGLVALGSDLAVNSEDFVESPFEQEVLDYVRSLGYECYTQVGTAEYRIDIGVRHKKFPGVFMLAIECDGAMYHSSKVARDRDKIRQAVLEDLGWTFHRIWGTKWYRYNEEERVKLREILEYQSKLNPTGKFVEKSKLESN